MATVATTDAKQITYLGVPVETWTLLTDETDPTSERVVVTRWLGDEKGDGAKTGDVTIKHMRGDGRTADCDVYEVLTLHPHDDDGDPLDWSDEEIGTCALEMLEG